MSDKRWTTLIESGSEGAWGDLISFRPPVRVQTRIREEPLDASVQAIEKGYGEINLDYYPVTIRRFPINFEGWGPKPRHNAESFLELFRRCMISSRQTQLWDPSVCEFAAFNEAEKSRWYGTEVLGTVLHIDMGLLGGNVDDGSITCSHATESEFRVSTIWIREDGYHPVSGNREFGMWRSGGTKNGTTRMNWETGRHYTLTTDEWTFYTRGADRVSTRFQNLPINDYATFAGGHTLWLGMQKRVSAFINSNGGAAVVRTEISQRLDWDAVQTLQWAPTTSWVEETT